MTSLVWSEIQNTVAFRSWGNTAVWESCFLQWPSEGHTWAVTAGDFPSAPLGSVLHSSYAALLISLHYRFILLWRRTMYFRLLENDRIGKVLFWKVMFLKIKGLRKFEVVVNSSLPSMLKLGNIYFHLKLPMCSIDNSLSFFSKTFKDSLMWREFSLLYNQNKDIGMQAKKS